MSASTLIVPAVERPLAVFDLDGTLLTSDSFLPFLITYARKWRRVFALAGLPCYLGMYACRILRDYQAKERLIRLFFAGEPAERIAAHAAWFCEHYVARRLRPDLVARLREHLASGDRVILLSASPDLYVPAIARSLGIPEVVCTRVEMNGAVCVGRLAGANCKGEDKVAALRLYLGRSEPPAGSSAYGDSRHDLPVLRWVECGFLVGKHRLTQVAAAPD